MEWLTRVVCCLFLICALSLGIANRGMGATKVSLPTADSRVPFEMPSLFGPRRVFVTIYDESHDDIDSVDPPQSDNQRPVSVVRVVGGPWYVQHIYGPLQSPRNLVAEAESSSSVRLAWSASPSPHESINGYLIFGIFHGIESLEAFVSVSAPTAFTVTNLTPGESVTFAVRAQGVFGQVSDPSNQATAAPTVQS